MSSIFTIKLKPTYVEEKDGVRIFQDRMKKFTENRDQKVLFVEAPTGAGKTTAFKDLNTIGSVMIVLPNRMLQNQVYSEIKDSKYSVSEINKDSIDNLSSLSGERRLDAVKELLTGRDFIITNPVILLNIMLNLYGFQNLISEKYKTVNLSSFLLKQGIKVIVVDEFHVYDSEQLAIILAINILLNNNIKFIYSSATPQIGVKKFFQDNTPDIILNEINVERLVNGVGVPIQGPLNINIINDIEAKEFIKENIDLFKKDMWLIILDKITDLDDCYRHLISGGVKKEDIVLISGYHGKMLNFDSRIVIASNIIEQGLNPPKKYDHILLDTGFSVKNIAQRIGRIGRGNEKTSEVFICLGKHISFDLINLESVNTIDDLFERFKPLFNQSDFNISPYLIGIFFGILSYFNKIEFIVREIIDKYPAIKCGFEDFTMVNSIILGNSSSELSKKFKKKRALNNVLEWWKIYLNSFAKFLPQVNTATGIDLSLDIDNPINVQYDELWILRNKKFEFINGQYKIIGNLETPDNDLLVSVKGLPFETSCKNISYKDWRYNCTNLIINRFKDSLDIINQTIDTSDFNNLFEILLSIVRTTAFSDRLIPCEMKSYESMQL
ncbi:MAG: DEAD/DEAH box helicase [Thermoplasmata archaeon]